MTESNDSDRDRRKMVDRLRDLSWILNEMADKLANEEIRHVSGDMEATIYTEPVSIDITGDKGVSQMLEVQGNRRYSFTADLVMAETENETKRVDWGYEPTVTTTHPPR